LSCGRITLLALVGFALSFAPGAEAQREFEPLFDKYTIQAEWTWTRMGTWVGLYHEETDRGSELHFEGDLDLGARKIIPSLDFEWQISPRHRLAGRWQDLERGSNSQTLTEIEWGDDIIPVDSDVKLSFDVEQFYVDYTYYPWLKDRWAGGFGIGLRIMEIDTFLSWSAAGGAGTIEGSEGARVTGPLPYLYGEYRRLLGENWRFTAGLGWLSVSIDDIDGGQWIGRTSMEILMGRHWGLGFSANIATIDVDWRDIADEDGLGTLNMTVDLDIFDLSIFGRVRF